MHILSPDDVVRATSLFVPAAIIILAYAYRLRMHESVRAAVTVMLNALGVRTDEQDRQEGLES